MAAACVSSDLSGFTFDDIIALPGSIDFGVDEVALDTRITRNIPMVRARQHFEVSTEDTKSSSSVQIGRVCWMMSRPSVRVREDAHSPKP